MINRDLISVENDEDSKPDNKIYVSSNLQHEVAESAKLRKNIPNFWQFSRTNNNLQVKRFIDLLKEIYLYSKFEIL